MAEIKEDVIVRSLGLIFNNAFLYGPHHNVTKNSVTQGFEQISAFLEARDQVSVTVVEKELLIDGKQARAAGALTKTLVDRFVALEISGFVVMNGIMPEEFEKFIAIVSLGEKTLKEIGGFVESVNSANLAHIKAKKIVYQQVEEDHVVAHKDKVGEGQGAAPAPVNVGQIVAFLKGDGDGDDAVSQKSIQGAASDPAKLAEMIVKAADVREGPATSMEGGESFTDIVVGCLRKTYKALSHDKKAKTQKGRKGVKKTLMLLEKDLLAKLRGMSDGTHGGDIEEAIAEAMGEMGDELEMDSLASDYAKKQGAMATGERKILRYMKSRSSEDIEESGLKEKLMADGLTEAGWEHLLLKSGVADEGQSGGAGAVGTSGGSGVGDAIGQLAILLSRLDDKMTSQPDVVPEVVSAVGEEVRGIADGTAQKIEGFVQGSLEEGDEKKKGLLDKSQTVVLAEIAQELCQPLSVLNCSVDMIKGQKAGAITEQQSELLGLAATSGERLSHLINKLMEISGVPEGMDPDSDILGAINP